ncbi:MAG: UDP-3-O-(3-hydroxymyristoyl)glucosamine N-acyltransferase [Planctomycetota bacterium]|nr:UDP-3-O-(3-hydroxymyristoyl)glucosamine N-acyltransferase [Planctomycetota bacterium]
MAGLNLTISQLADRIGGRVVGDGSAVITGIAPLSLAGADDVSFLADDKHSAQLAETNACAVIVGGGTGFQPVHNGTASKAVPPPLIRVDNVMSAVTTVLEMSAGPEDLPPAGVHPTAVVADDADIAGGAAVGPGAVVGSGAKIAAGAVLCAGVTAEAGVTIGEETVLYPGTVVVGGCRIGRRCRIGPCAVIGSVGFGYYFAEGRHNRIPHVGSVEIGDDVDIGACSCVDRGKFASTPTRIGDGTRIDNLVQIAHSVQVGRNCALAAQVGIAGSTVLGDYVILGGHVGVRDNIVLGAGVKAAACSCIAQDVPDGAAVSGIPAFDARKWLRTVKVLPEIPELKRQIRQLEKRLSALESAND